MNGLARLMEESNARDLAKVVESSLPYVPFSDPLSRRLVLNYICRLEPDFLRVLETRRKLRYREVRRLRALLRLPWNTTMPEIRKSTLARCEEVMTAEDKGGSILHREPRDKEEMAQVSKTINNLVDRLLAEAWWVSEIEAPGAHPALYSPDSVSTMIRLLRSDGYPSYTHPDADAKEAAKQRARLNEVNLQILLDWVPPFRERYVGKMCFNFLVCGVPPGIQNYNLLILGFSLLGESNLAQAVVDSFLESSLRPTEATYLCLLHHYRLKQDLPGFIGILRRLFGYDPRGINLERLTADSPEQARSLRAWAAGRENVAVLERGKTYVERALLTQNVAEAVMEGLIDFELLREAAKLLAVCLHAGYSVSRDVLWRLFHACLTASDTEAAKIIIRGLLDNIDHATSMLLGPKPIGHSLVRQLRHLLNIWQATSRFDRSRTHDILELQQPGNPEQRRAAGHAKLKHLATAIWIRETYHHSSMMGWWLRRVQRTLSEDKPLSERLDMAAWVLNLATERPARQMAKSELIQRVARLAWLTRQVAAADLRIQHAETHLCNLLARQTPRKLRAHAQFNPAMPIKARIGMALPFGVPGSWEYKAAMCFEWSKEIDMQLKTAILEAMPQDLALGLWQTRNDSGDIRLGRIVAYFEQYLANLKSQVHGEARKRAWARLLKRLPRVSRMAFWRRSQQHATSEAAPAPATAASG
ncbi:7cf2c1b4-df04-4f5f-9f31-643a272651d6 [Thermothielavioides terrestris]|nr:7cf2c1b4-df04-4f5f-9f31-643a272651d6 [Thermothielavioides terrestris]